MGSKTQKIRQGQGSGSKGATALLTETAVPAVEFINELEKRNIKFSRLEDVK